MKRLDQRGETLVEVVMALGILSLVLVSSYALATGTFRLGRGAGERTQAVNYLQQQAEALRTYRDKTGWSDFRTKVTTLGGASGGGTFCMVKTTVGADQFWQPTANTGSACLIDDRITIAIGVADADPDKTQAPGSLSQQYRFDVFASWKTASQDNNANIQLILADQGVK